MSISALEAHLLRRHALGREPLARLVLELLELGLDRGRVDASATWRRYIVGDVVADVDEQAAERRGDARVGRHDHGRDRQLPRQRRRRAARPAPPKTTSANSRGS